MNPWPRRSAVSWPQRGKAGVRQRRPAWAVNVVRWFARTRRAPIGMQAKHALYTLVFAGLAQVMRRCSIPVALWTVGVNKRTGLKRVQLVMLRIFLSCVKFHDFTLRFGERLFQLQCALHRLQGCGIGRNEV